MRHLAFSLAALVITGLFPATAHGIEGRLMRNPGIGGESIVFTYEDDLWTAPIAGGSATRITSHPGVEIFAAFSPDGKWIAFTGSYDGGNDVYVIPATGGEPVRLTYHPSYNRVIGWTPDGKAVLFVSMRGLYPELFAVEFKGGSERKYPFAEVAYASFSPDGRRAALNRWNSDRMNWKGYQGGAQQDVFIAPVEGGELKRITDWPGYDNFPMWHGEKIYFNSDREDGRMNLFAYDLSSGTTKRCTFHKEWDVEFPALGAGRIVYGCSGFLYVYDIASGKDQRLSIEIPTDRWRMRDMFVSPGGYLQDIGLDGDGKKCVVQARGDVYLLDTEKDDAANLTRTMGSRELYPALSPKTDTVAFFSDRTGEYELYIAPTKPGADWTQVTHGSKTYYYHVAWSPNGKRLLFGDKDYATYVADLESKKVARIDRCLFQKDNEISWEISDYSWAPDSRWIAYSKADENLNSSIYLYSLDQKKLFRITDDRYDSYSPCFDPEGRYLYFLSLRNFTPSLDWFMDNHVNLDQSCVMAVQLRAGQKPPFEEKEDEDTSEKDTTKVEPGTPLMIDFDGIADRIFEVPVAPGTYRMLSAYKGHITYLSRKEFGFPGLDEFFNPKSVTYYDLHNFNLREKTDKLVLPGIGYYTLSADGGKVAYMSGGNAGVIKTEEPSVPGEGGLRWGGLEQRVDVFQEYPQIFRDVWRQVRDFFYDPAMHGRNWDTVYKKYEELIPFVSTRGDMNYIIGQVIGELTASHEYIIDRGGPPRTFYSHVNVGLLGADLEADWRAGRYRFTHIIEGTNWDHDYANPLQAPNVKVKAGDFLISIDGQDVKSDENYLKYLENKAGEEISLTVSSTPEKKDARTYRVKTLYNDTGIRYREWVERNYRRVRDATGGRVGYMHLSDMDELGIQQFEQAFRAERFRDGLIIDVRDNGGGFVSWFIMDKLERKLMYYTVTRDFEPMPYPSGAHGGPIVVICNEGTGSDGEVFTQHFKDLGLGTVVGTRTWGGLIGITNVIPLTDGGTVTQSNVGFANMKKQWIVENVGAVPDIVVDNDPSSVVAGKDPQLEKAIEVIMGTLKESPQKFVPPPFPKK